MSARSFRAWRGDKTDTSTLHHVVMRNRRDGEQATIPKVEDGDGDDRRPRTVGISAGIKE